MIKKSTYEKLEELLEKRTNEAAKTSELLNQKEKEFTQTIKLLDLQRNLSISLSSTNDLKEGLRISLEICIQASGMDCGGIYLFDEGNGDLNLTVHQGLTEEFVKSISHYDKDSENARFVKKGKLAYTLRKDLSVSMTREERRKGSLAFATLPLLDEGNVIGCINLASQRFEEIPSPVRVVIETIVAQMGSAIGRLKARDALEELNAALNVLLKKIKEEKNELENSMLSNISALIEPYLEKLQNGGLSERQKAYLEIIQANLKDIISPFVRNFSSSYYRLTPQEIKIANQIKLGKTSKEIATRMNLSPKTIEFHRRNIRKKLGLNRSKENLRTRLSLLK